MKYAGILCIFFAAIFVSAEYSGYMNKRTAECRGFLAFISHMRIQVECFLRPARELARGFSSDSLEKAGFIEALCNCENISEAYLKCEDALSLSREEKDVLSGFFSSFGDGYLDQQIKLIESAHTKMDGLYTKLDAERVKNTKLVSAISVTLAFGLVILII